MTVSQKSELWVTLKNTKEIMTTPTRLNIALLSGGRSSEREVSLNSGREVFEALDKSKYDITCYDPLTDIPRIVADAPKIDAALVILHGAFGEDGTVQGLLQLLDIPFQGSGVLGSAMAMNKLAAKRVYEQNSIPTPPCLVLSKNEPLNLEQCLETLGLPLIVKPVEAGSSVGMTKVKNQKDLCLAIAKAFEYDNMLLVEKFLPGREITVAVLGNDELTTLPVIEIVPNEGYDFYDYDAKYKAGESKEICPAEISDDLARKAQIYAMTAHKALFCRGYSRTDMICHGDEFYVLETNTIPGMTRTSLIPLAAKTAGMSFTKLLDRLIELSLEDYHARKNLKK
jgi:D-alanine-D-alanine ligase